jgi:hypothetical protein
MPARAIEHHHNMVMGMALGHLIQEDLHAVGVDLGQDQSIHYARQRLHGCVRVGVLMREHGDAHRAMGLGCPALAYVVDATKARLVLEH